MRLLALLATCLGKVRRDRRSPALPASGGDSLPVLARAALRPGQGTWLVARAVSLRAF
jgi:hypothetical protein